MLVCQLRLKTLNFPPVHSLLVVVSVVIATFIFNPYLVWFVYVVVGVAVAALVIAGSIIRILVTTKCKKKKKRNQSTSQSWFTQLH